MALAEKWWEIERALPAEWMEARVRIDMHGQNYAERAAALLGPANPVRHGLKITVYVSQHGRGVGPKALSRLLTRLDEEGLSGALELVSHTDADAPVTPEDTFLADDWDELTAGLPSDWSDVYAEIELDSTDYLEPGALALAPVNPARVPGETTFRFRSARRSGYGASAAMVHRCMERLDERGITGTVRILRVLSDTKHVSTQGPVWYVGGRSV